MLTFGSMMKQHAKTYKDKRAVIFQGEETTYAQLNSRANRIANAFLEAGFKKGDKLAICMQNHAAYIELMVGLAKIGVILVPINFRLKGKELEYIVSYSRSKGLVIGQEYEGEIASLLPSLSLEQILVVGQPNYPEIKSYESFLSSNDGEPLTEVIETDPLYIGYTSGTTGKPKGVVISHRSRMLTGMVAAYEYRILEDDIQIVPGPIYHAAPWIFLMMQLIVGGTLVIQKGFEPEQFLKDVEKYKVTNCFMAPTMFNFIVNLDQSVTKRYDFSYLRVLISAGAPLPSQLKNDILQFFDPIDLHEFYGSTESAITLNIKPQDIRKKNACVGKPFPFVECVILDYNKQPVKQGEVGELFIKAPYLLDYYYNNEQATEECFYGDYFTVGDMATQDEEGFYYIVDRKKDMLISGGVNIYPREIEEVLHMHPDVADVAVIGVPDPVWGESVKAIVVPKGEGVISEEDIIAFCEKHIASFKKPKSVDFIKELPRNPSGKILKTELREPYWSKKTI